MVGTGTHLAMTALKAAQVDAFVAKPNPAQPVVLVYGADAGLVRERAEALIRAAVDDLNDPFSLVRLEGDDACRRSRAAWSRRRTPSRCSAAAARSG